MTASGESRFPRALALSLAGLEAGMMGALLLLGWMGIASVWHRRSFWTSENLMASVFYGSDAIRGGFNGRTVSGLALYLLIYSILGAFFASAVQTRLPRFRTALLGVLFALSWYYLSFHAIWKAAAPLITRLHMEAPTIWGHVLYGAMLGGYPAYFQRWSEEPKDEERKDEPPVNAG